MHFGSCWVGRSEILVDAHLAIRPVFILDRLDLIGFNIYFDTYYTKSKKINILLFGFVLNSSIETPALSF